MPLKISTSQQEPVYTDIDPLFTRNPKTSDVVLTTSRDVLEQAAAGDGPDRLIITLGCAGWSAGQLEEEILRNGWLTVKADPSILFEVPIEERFTAAMHLLGFDPSDLAGEAGHA